MEAHQINFPEVQLVTPSKRRGRNKNSSDSWITSFADVVTVLLCFFIIFYMVEKQYKKSYGFGPSAGTMKEYKTKMSTPDVLSFIETLAIVPNITVINKDQFVEVHFPAEMFFESGETKLTPEGRTVIDEIISPLTNIKEGYMLQIQGYTDDIAVRSLKSRWWKNNMELSIERSLEVYDYLIKNGVSHSILSVTGFGANKPRYTNKESNSKLIDNNINSKGLERRISLKFEPVLYVK